MRHSLRRTLGFPLAIAAVTAVSPYATAAQAQTVAYETAQFTAEELDNLLAPVALYPDPILAQVLVAASYPDEIELAAYHLSTYGNSGIDDQPWDMSVKAVAHYPPVLNLMADRIDWTIALGQAYVEQPNDVMAAVQSLRSMARAQGNLVSTQQHQVVVEDRYIRILPTQPRAVYVPVYDPIAVYHRPVVHLGVYRNGWSFGVAFPIGVWLTYDFDWRHRHVYYHGWDPYYRRGWIHRSRPYIVINNIYVHSRPRVVVANRGVFNRRFDYRRFDRYNSVHRNVTWERHHRRYADSGSSWGRSGRSNQGNIGRRSPSWDRSGRIRGNDGGRRAIPRSNVASQQRTNGQRAEPRQQAQRSPSWDRNGSSNGRTGRATRNPSWDRSGRIQADNNGNRRATGRSSAAAQSGRSAPQRAQPRRSNTQRTEPRALPQRTSPQQAQPRGQPQRSSSPRAQPQRSTRQRAEPRAQPQRASPQAQPRGQSQRSSRQRAQPQRTSPQVQPQRTSSQGRGSARVQSSPTRGQSSSTARSAPAQKRERASSPSRSNGSRGKSSGSKGRGRRP